MEELNCDAMMDEYNGKYNGRAQQSGDLEGSGSTNEPQHWEPFPYNTLDK